MRAYKRPAVAHTAPPLTSPAQEACLRRLVGSRQYHAAAQLMSTALRLAGVADVSGAGGAGGSAAGGSVRAAAAGSSGAKAGTRNSEAGPSVAQGEPGVQPGQGRQQPELHSRVEAQRALQEQQLAPPPTALPAVPTAAGPTAAAASAVVSLSPAPAQGLLQGQQQAAQQAQQAHRQQLQLDTQVAAPPPQQQPTAWDIDLFGLLLEASPAPEAAAAGLSADLAARFSALMDRLPPACQAAKVRSLQ